jgi:hypothetical protein
MNRTHGPSSRACVPVLAELIARALQVEVRRIRLMLAGDRIQA